MDIILSTLFALLLSLPSTPGRPDLPPERLLEISNHAAIGTIVRVYTKEITDPHYLTTLCLAEIAVEEVVKSDSLQIGNRVFVKYSFKTVSYTHLTLPTTPYV